MQAFKAIEPLLHVWFKVPLYKKYADLLAGENAVIPDDILLQEAGQCADFLNASPEPLHLGAHRVTAAAAKANA